MILTKSIRFILVRRLCLYIREPQV
jgi:hypothetical protein